MSTTIRERIMEEAALIAGGVTGIGTVRRWDATGRTTYGHLDCIIAPGQETAADSGIGNPSGTRRTLELIVSVVLFPSESASDDTDELIQTWTGNLHAAFAANRLFIETATAVRLAIDSMPGAVDAPDYVDGASAAAIKTTITYEHDGDSPYRLGTAIAAD